MSNCIYILFSRQNTKIGRFIRLFLRNTRYSHVSVSLDPELRTVYSFARSRFDSPFSGGFVREYPSRFLISDRDINVKICKVELTEKEYIDAKSRLQYCLNHQDEMLYNLYDALLTPLNRRFRLKNAYTCVGFAAYILGVYDQIPNIHALEDLCKDSIVYEGSLKALIEQFRITAPNDGYFNHQGLYAAAKDFVKLNKRLLVRYRKHSIKKAAK